MPLTPIVVDQPSLYQRLRFTPDSKYLISAANENQTSPFDDDRTSIIVFALLAGAEAWRIYDRFSSDPYVAVSPDSRTLAVSNRQHIGIWDLSSGELIRTLLDVRSTRSHPGYLEASFSPAGDRIAFSVSQEESAIGVRDGDVYVVDIRSGEKLRTLRITKNREAIKLQFSPDGRYLTGIGYRYDTQDRVCTWDLGSGRKISTLGAGIGQDHKFVLSQHGRYVADGGQYVRVWERVVSGLPGKAGWKQISKCRAQKYGAWFTEFSADESLVAAMGAEALTHEGDPHLAYSVLLIKAATGQLLATCPMEGRCFCFGLSHDGTTLATMSAQVPNMWSGDAPEYFLTLWDVPLGRKRQVHATPSLKTNLLFHAPHSMAFSPDDRWLAVGHHEHIEIWDLSSQA